MQYGYCPYEEMCAFAHGPEELQQNLIPNMKYKTKRCLAFFRRGYCRFGDRCNYLHQMASSELQNYIEQKARKWK
jgi:hypothetical protein